MKALNLIQSKKGYRYSIDALLLADFIQCKSTETWIDLGTGCAIIPIYVAMKKEYYCCWAIEIQPQLCWIANQNILNYNLSSKIKILNIDIREANYYFEKNSIDFVVSNPPYRQLYTGKLNSNWEKSIARHQLFLNETDLMEAASYLLKKGGFFYFISHYDLANNFYHKLLNYNFYPHTIRYIIDSNNKKVRFVLIKAGKERSSKIKKEEIILHH